MKKLIFALLLIPFSSKAQEVRHFCNYDCEATARHIMMGHIKDYCYDTVSYLFQYRKIKQLSPQQVEKKLKKVIYKGASTYSSRTNGGYTFTIAVIDEKDYTNVLYYIKFEVDHFYQKITYIEISKGQ